MRALAERLGEDAEKWGLAGLLHDLDAELTKDDFPSHGKETVRILTERGVDAEILDAIQMHNEAAVNETRSSVFHNSLAAGETITDHRGEGEPYRRKLAAEELNSMARTAIGKSMDVNHQPEFQTDATILDVEFDKNRREMQMLVIERDREINNAIVDGIITEVCINGGMQLAESSDT